MWKKLKYVDKVWLINNCWQNPLPLQTKIQNHTLKPPLYTPTLQTHTPPHLHPTPAPHTHHPSSQNLFSPPHPHPYTLPYLTPLSKIPTTTTHVPQVKEPQPPSPNSVIWTNGLLTGARVWIPSIHLWKIAGTKSSQVHHHHHHHHHHHCTTCASLCPHHAPIVARHPTPTMPSPSLPPSCPASLRPSCSASLPPSCPHHAPPPCPHHAPTSYDLIWPLTSPLPQWNI